MLGGDPPADLGLPGGRLSATDINAAIGDCPDAVLVCVCCPAVGAADSGGELVRVLNGEPALVPFVFATDTGAV